MVEPNKNLASLGITGREPYNTKFEGVELHTKIEEQVEIFVRSVNGQE